MNKALEVEGELDQIIVSIMLALVDDILSIRRNNDLHRYIHTSRLNDCRRYTNKTSAAKSHHHDDIFISNRYKHDINLSTFHAHDLCL